MTQNNKILLNEFQTKELESLRQELNDSVKAIWEIERYALTLTGGIWAWGIPQANKGFAAVMWLPLGLNLLFGLRALALYRHVNRISGYLLLVERKLWGGERQGWENYFRKNTDPLTLITAYVFWGSLILASLILPIFAG